MTITRMTMMAAMMGWTAAALAKSGQPKQKLTVYVENRAQTSNAILFHAESLATRMFAEIGVALEWRSGTPSRASTGPVILMQLVVDTPGKYRPGALAYSLPFEGVHTTLFYDRIEEGPVVSTASVLAHVMVHEITHLVQGIDLHSDSGVMKAHWSERDLVDMAVKPLAFTPLDVQLINSGLRSRAARQAALVAAR